MGFENPQVVFHKELTEGYTSSTVTVAARTPWTYEYSCSESRRNEMGYARNGRVHP